MQERNGYFFCIEDRALFCKHCDVSTHMRSPFASSHRRFLITGVKVALQPSINTNDIISSPTSTTTSFNFPADNESRAAMAPMNVEAASTTESRATFSGAELDPFAIGPSNWLLNEVFDPNDFNYYEFSEVGSSRISTTPWNSYSSTPNCLICVATSFAYINLYFVIYYPFQFVQKALFVRVGSLLDKSKYTKWSCLGRYIPLDYLRLTSN